MAATAGRPHGRGHIVVCGDNALAYRIAEDVAVRYGRPVTVVVGSRRQHYGPQISALPRVRVVEAERLDAELFRRARLDTAAALALVHADDAANIRAALTARDVAPDVRLAVRIIRPRLVQRAGYVISGQLAAFADATMLARDIVAATMDVPTAHHIDLPGGTLRVARRREVPDSAVICSLTADATDGELLPRETGADGLVLASASAGGRLPRRRPILGEVRRRVSGFLWAAGHSLVQRRIHLVGLALGGLLLAGTVAFAFAAPGGFLGAAYVTVLTAIGGGEPDNKLTGAAKLVQVLVTFLGTMLVVPAVSAAVNAGRQDFGTRQARDHVIVVGLGAIGTRAMTDLAELGVSVVAVEQDDRAHGMTRARRLGVPVVVGDATDDDVLELARIRRCRAVLALTGDDLTNLQVGLAIRELRPDARAVLWLGDDDLAARTEGRLERSSLRSVAHAASRHYVTALLGHAVVGTIPAGRRVLLVAQVLVEEGGPRHGVAVGALNRPGQVTAIGVLRDGVTTWRPEPERKLRAGDELLVVATRDGLAALLA